MTTSAAQADLGGQAKTTGNPDFLAAWKRGAALAGPSLFHAGGVGFLVRATHHRQLSPDMPLIRKAIANRPTQAATFLAVMVSMYNETEGNKLMIKSGTTLGKLPSVLSADQMAVTTALLTHHKGW